MKLYEVGVIYIYAFIIMSNRQTSEVMYSSENSLRIAQAPL